MIKAVFFDIDNTLCNYDKADNVAMEKLIKFGKAEFALSPEKMNCLLSKAQEIILERLGTNSAATHNRLIRFQCFLEILQYSDFTKALKMDKIYWDTFLEDITLEPGLGKLLKALQKARIVIGIGSDQNSDIQYKKLEKLGILPYFSRIVTSEEAGAEKPTSQFFQLCVKKAGCLAEECVFIGDNIKKDVEGALQNGLHGVWYQPKQYKSKKNKYPVIHSYMDCLKEDGIQLGEEIICFADRRI